MDDALVFNISRGTSHDGPGIRTTIFFSGCPLRCGWCHNPEGIYLKKRVWWEEQRCIGCGLCQSACKNRAVRSDKNRISANETACVRCGACVSACPSSALTFTATEYTEDELLKEAVKDKAFYDETGGGVTVSGGECMMRHTFIAGFFKSLHRLGINTALDTSGFAAYEDFEDVLPDCDLILYDIKLMDDAKHIMFTGVSNTLILENLARIAKEISDGKISSRLWLRTPLIPDVTATEENISAIGSFITEKLYGIPCQWELCAFNNSCGVKYERLGLQWPYAGASLMKKKDMEKLKNVAVKSGVSEKSVVISGLMAE